MCPCYDPVDSGTDCFLLKRELDQRTAMLCKVISIMEICGDFEDLPQHILAWYALHKDFDQSVITAY